MEKITQFDQYLASLNTRGTPEVEVDQPWLISNVNKNHPTDHHHHMDKLIQQPKIKIMTRNFQDMILGVYQVHP